MTRSKILFFEKQRRHGWIVAIAVALAGTAGAQITVNAPANDSVVNSPFYLQAESASCQSQPTATMTYSIDNGADAPNQHAQSLQAMVAGVSKGTHTLHVKAWNGMGQVCTQAVALTVGDGLSVSAPAQGATVTSPFVLEEQATSCGGQGTSKMTYSLDSGQDNTFDGTSLNTTVSTSTGQHILRAKTWGSSGAYCETDVQLNVATTAGLAPGSGATQYPNMQNDGNYIGTYANCGGANGPHDNLWQTQPDCDTPGNKTGSTTTVSTPIYGADSTSREFTMTTGPSGGSSGGGVRWFDQAITPANYPTEPSATHFQYDAYVYLVDNTQVMNIEMDINHSINATDVLYIMGVQCNLQRGVWQVTASRWVDTPVPCTRSQVTSGVWHHFQIQSHHDPNSGAEVYYDAVAIDGNPVDITKCQQPSGSVYSSSEPTVSCLSEVRHPSPAWSDFIGPNFQLDEMNASGTATAYVDTFSVFYW